jgi:hypothetical protein
VIHTEVIFGCVSKNRKHISALQDLCVLFQVFMCHSQLIYVTYTQRMWTSIFLYYKELSAHYHLHITVQTLDLSAQYHLLITVQTLELSAQYHLYITEETLELSAQYHLHSTGTRTKCTISLTYNSTDTRPKCTISLTYNSIDIRTKCTISLTYSSTDTTTKCTIPLTYNSTDTISTCFGINMPIFHWVPRNVINTITTVPKQRCVCVCVYVRALPMNTLCTRHSASAGLQQAITDWCIPSTTLQSISNRPNTSHNNHNMWIHYFCRSPKWEVSEAACITMTAQSMADQTISMPDHCYVGVKRRHNWVYKLTIFQLIRRHISQHLRWSEPTVP